MRERGEGGEIERARERQTGTVLNRADDQQHDIVFLLACCVHSEMLFAHTVDIAVGIQGICVGPHLIICFMLTHPLLLLYAYEHSCMHSM